MTPRDRIECVLAGDAPDGMSILGGFLIAEKQYREVAGASEAEFNAAPEAVTIRSASTVDQRGRFDLEVLLPPDYKVTYRTSQIVQQPDPTEVPDAERPHARSVGPLQDELMNAVVQTRKA